jgi:hypothetical protein
MNKRIYTLIFTLVLTKGFSQIMPYKDLFFWNKEDLAKNRVQKIEAYEFEYFKDSIIADSNINKGLLQVEEIYDSLGRIVSKTNFYSYSDVEYIKRSLGYNPDGTVNTYLQFSKDSLIQTEFYLWQNHLLKEWKILMIKDGEKHHFDKEIKYNTLNQPILEILKHEKKTVQSDSIKNYQYKNLSIRVRKNAKTKEVLDSIVTFPLDGDTVYKKEIYKNKLLVYKEVHWIKDNETTQRIEEYEDGIFHKVYYRRLSNGRIIFEKQIHVVPNLNFDKLYYYDGKGMPVKKEVYHNQSAPTSVVYYKITKR